MATIRIPYLKFRDGRPRWEPGPGLRRAGFKGRDLKSPGGAWLGLEEAIAAARDLNAEAAAWRNTGRRRRRPRLPVAETRTCRALVEDWQGSVRHGRLRASTRADYTRKIAIWLEAFGDAPIIAVTTPQLHGFWETCYRQRGHAMANGIMAVVRAVLSHGRKIGWLKDNPATGLGLPGVAPRQVIWTPEEIVALVAAADAMNLASVGDAALIALHSGQRQGDVLRMPPHIFDAGGIRLSQLKTGALIDAPMTTTLATRIAKARGRKTHSGLTSIETFVVFEATGRPYSSHTFRHRFAAVRASASRREPSCATKKFLDLRDTAVTRLALADCTMAQIGAITGHSQQTIHTIMKHYLVLDSAMARQAIDKVDAWMVREGITL